MFENFPTNPPAPKSGWEDPKHVPQEVLEPDKMYVGSKRNDDGTFDMSEALSTPTPQYKDPHNVEPAKLDPDTNYIGVEENEDGTLDLSHALKEIKPKDQAI